MISSLHLRAILAFATLATLAWPVNAAKPSSRELRPEALFEQNLGQFDSTIAYAARFSGFRAAVSRDGSIVLAPDAAPGSQVRIRTGSSQQPAISGLRRAEYRTNYFNSTRPVTDVPHYGRVSVKEVEAGIDLIYYTSAGKLEFDFVARPGSRPEAIRLALEGASSLSIGVDGDLSIHSGGGTLIQRKPVAYQMKHGTRVPVDCDYRLIDEKTIALALGQYDTTLDLVVDPVVEYASYLGGSSIDMVRDVKIGPGGYIYVTGSTASSNFPVATPLDSSLGGPYDVFVTKINPYTGKAVYSTFLGGRNSDSGVAIAVDGAGNVFVTGGAGDQFPTTANAYRTTWANPSSFVAKLNSTGSALLYSTFIPGTSPAAIALDPQGKAVIVGNAGTLFTPTAGAFRTTFGGASGTSPSPGHGDAFALRLNATGSAVEFATFYGGSLGEAVAGGGLDAAGNVVIAGNTVSTNLPMTADAIQPTIVNANGTDGFVAILSASGNSLLSATYLGGAESDEILGVAVDAIGDIVVVGHTWSTNFPSVAPLIAYSDLAIGEYIAMGKGFATKIARNPLRIAFSTFVGSKAQCCETATSVAVDAAGEIYVGGTVNASKLHRFEAKHAFLTAAQVLAKQGPDSSSIYSVSAIRRDGGAFVFNSLIAPSGGNTEKFAVAAKSAGQVAVAGSTYATWVPIAPLNHQPINASPTAYYEGFVMSLGLELPDLDFETSVQKAAASSTVKLSATTFAATAEQTVTFWDGATALGTAQLSNGIATLNASFPAGVRRLKATLGATQSRELALPVHLPIGVCQ